MATCPRCLGPLSDGHRCRPIWIKRLRRQVLASLFGGALGSFVQFLLEPKQPPVMGFVIGGLVMFALSEAFNAAD